MSHKHHKNSSATIGLTPADTFQLDFPLDPVEVEADGSYRWIDQLSYAPPVDWTQHHENIASVARRLWADAGGPWGRDLDFWLAAKRYLGLLDERWV